jgi:hypothetical protein
MKRALSPSTVVLAFALLFIFLVAPEIVVAAITLLITLLIGWWPSMVRLIRAWHPGAGGIALFILAVVLLLAGSHSFARWLYASLRDRSGSRWPASWRWKWTLCGYAILACTLVAICCLVLTTHQIYWFSKSSDPILDDVSGKQVGPFIVASDLQKDAEELQWDTAKTRDVFLKKEVVVNGKPATETIQPVWIEKDDHTLRAIILIPRRPLIRATAWVAVLQPGKELASYKLDELPRVLASFGIGSTGQIPSLPAPLLP